MTDPRVQRYRDAIKAPMEITAPSGEKYTVRRLTPMDYIKEGLEDIPNDFFKFVLSLQSGLKTGLTPEEERKNYELFEKYIQITVELGVISPPVVVRYDKEKTETHLLWGEIPPKDQEYILGSITGRIQNESKSTPEEIKPDTNKA